MLKKEPVLLGAVFLAIGDAQFNAESPWRAVVIAAVAWVVRMLSTPEQAAAERVDEATVIGEQVGRVKAEDDLRAYARARRAKRN